MSRVTPYSPMKPKPKDVSFDRMADILARNAQPKVEVMPRVPDLSGRPTGEGKSVDAGAASVENTPLVEWEKPEPMCRILSSKCGHYRIRKWSGAEALTGPPRYRYQAEYLVPDLWWYGFKQIRASAVECKADCEEHARGMRK